MCNHESSTRTHTSEEATEYHAANEHRTCLVMDRVTEASSCDGSKTAYLDNVKPERKAANSVAIVAQYHLAATLAVHHPHT